MSDGTTRSLAESTCADTIHPSLSVRVSPHSYFAAFLIGTFISAFLFYLELDPWAIAAFAVSWVAVPFLAINDKVTFDGGRIARMGHVPRLWSWFNISRMRLKVRDIEQVETLATRTLRRGGNVVYRYRTVIRGRGLSVSISSGGEDYRRMIKAILPRLPVNLLDTRSIELCDHLADPKETLMKAEFSHIPSAEVLENSFRVVRSGKQRSKPAPQTKPEDNGKVDDLRSLANELRLSGFHFQALEAFRRALTLRPADGWLLFELARCLDSLAGVERDDKLKRRAIAALRLSERRAGTDGELLVRLGEFYFQVGDWHRSGIVFQKALERVGENFRTARGLAEIALREGKIAHVIHHFSAANRVASVASLKRWSKAEADYFSNLQSDDEYMDMELGRVGLLETVERSKMTALKVAFIGFPLILTGLLFEDDLVANIGWAVSSVGLLVWIALIVASQTLGSRIPYSLMASDE